MGYILFYSNYCEHSTRYIDILQRSGVDTYFMKICIDRNVNNGLRPKIMYKYNIESVPSIIVEDNTLYYGKNALLWLDKFIRYINNSQGESQGESQDYSKEEYNNIDNYNNVEVSGKNDENIRSATINKATIKAAKIDNSSNGYVLDPNKGNKSNNKFVVPTKVLVSNKEFMMSLNQDKGAINSAHLKNDKLKKKQFDNEYYKMMKEREQDFPKDSRAPVF